MNYTLMFFLVALIYIFMAIHTLSKDRLDIRNRLYFAVAMDFAFWGLLNATLFLITEPEIAANTRKYLVFSWGVVYSLILHLVLVLSGYDKKINKYSLYILLYFPALINIWLYFFTPIKGVDLLLTSKGWVISNFFEGSFLWDNYFYVYYISFTCLTIFFLFIWHKKTEKLREKMQSKLMFVTICIAFVLGSIFEIILPLQGVLLFYGVTIIIALIPVAGIWYAIEKYGLMNFNPNNLAFEVLQMMSEGLIICDLSGQIMTMNKGVESILGFSAENQPEKIDQLFKEKLNLSSCLKPKEVQMLNKNNKIIETMMSALPLKDRVLELYGYLLVFQDISKLTKMQKQLIQMNEILEDTVLDRTNELLAVNESLRKEVEEKQIAKEKIKHLAYYDQLTNLPNLRLFTDYIKSKIDDYNRNHKKFAVLFIDLDGFKTINDTKGHSKGDALLKVVSMRLLNHMKHGDLVARAGGDEFYCIIDLNQQQNYLTTYMNTLLELFDEPIAIEDTKMYITCSIGASIYPDHGLAMEELVKHSDIAMYAAKENGKNRCEIFTNRLYEKITNEEQMKDGLRKAIVNNEFELFYQPLIDANTNKLLGCEALIRWNHPKLGVVSPHRFITIAEENGFIEPIGNWVIQEAMNQHLKWKDQFNIDMQMSINLSVNQLLKKDIVFDILKLKDSLNIDMSNFEFEVTESIFIDEKSFALESIKKISETGAKIVIDDFGKAYSSLAYIKKLPITKIKIDKYFVDGIHKDDKDEAIIKTIITLCENLHIDVVAEGAETKEQVQFLKDCHCHKIQGYYYSKPLCIEDFNQYLMELY